MIFSMKNTYFLNSLAPGDFNNDKQLDLVFVNSSANQVGVIFGIGNGSFRGLTTFSTGAETFPIQITVSDFNNDSYLDIAVVYHQKDCVVVFLGNGNGSFSAQTMLPTGLSSSPVSTAVADFNIDGYLDIVVCSSNTINAVVYLGDGNGNFQVRKSFYIGTDSSPLYVAVGDFNGDTLSDIVFSNNILNNVGVMFGHSNTTLGIRKKFAIKISKIAYSVAVGDFNCDGHLDIAVGETKPYGIDVLVGDGNGDFDLQTILSTKFMGSTVQINVGDFNGDGCQDIIAVNRDDNIVDILLNTCECCTHKIVETSTLLYH